MKTAVLALLVAATLFGQVRLAPDGWFRNPTGELWLPLGGFHGNEIPVALVKISPEEWQRVAPHVWTDQQTAGQGHIDLWDASDELMRQWFGILARNGVTAVRLFPRARVGADVLDLCGKLNPELREVFHRAFAAAQPYHIRFLLQIIPEPWLTGYANETALKQYVLPRYSSVELAHLSAPQRRFLIARKPVDAAGWFTDPDALACQKQYLEQALDWVAAEPQVFALELYNEQGWSRTALRHKPEYLFTFPWENAEIRWTAMMAALIHQRLPAMPVTISHPGSGVTGFDPIAWSRESGVDFYSSHLYAGACGESARVDFAAVTGATAAIIRAGAVNFPGEWGVLESAAPEEIRRRAHRDALWLSLTAGAPGFMQWTYEFLDEYRRAREVFASLPTAFSPQRPALQIDIGACYHRYQDPARYPLAAFPFNRQKQTDENLQRILAAYERSIQIGVPVSFSLAGGMPLNEFQRTDAAKLPRPIRASSGWQLSYLADVRHAIWVAYLRSRRVRAYGKHYLADPEQAPLEIRFALPQGKYAAELWDLASGAPARRTPVKEHGRLKVARRTADDYVIVVRRTRGSGEVVSNTGY